MSSDSPEDRTLYRSSLADSADSPEDQTLYRSSLDDSADQELQLLMQKENAQGEENQDDADTLRSNSREGVEQQHKNRVETPDQTYQMMEAHQATATRTGTPDETPDQTYQMMEAHQATATRTGTPDGYEDLNRLENLQQRVETPGSAGDVDNFDNDKETEEYYAQASEQLLLQQELQKLKDEGIIPQSDEPVFDYDIGERVKQLNAKLAIEGATPEKTNRRVIFSDNLVEFSPSPEVNGEESESGTPRTDHRGDEMDPNDLEVEKLTLNDSNQDENQALQRWEGAGDVSAAGEPEGAGQESLPDYKLDRLSNEESRENGLGGDQPDGQSFHQPDEQNQTQEQILLERNGKFELVNVMDLSAEERIMMGLKPVEKQNSNDSVNTFSPSKVAYQPSPPPRKPRPSTATGESGVRRQQLAPRRIQSAKTHREAHGGREGHGDPSGFDWEARSSGYGMSPEQKASMRKMYRLQLQRQKEEQETQEDEKRRAQDESQKAFEWWLEKKKEEDKQKRKEEKERRKQGEEEKERDPDTVFQAWVEKKRQQMKDERLRVRLEDKMKLAEQEASATNPEGTYQAWLNNKKEQAKFERQIQRKMEEEKERAFYTRDRKDCDKAFKEWLRSKNTQHREDRSMKRATATYSQKTAKISRKSRQLAKALQIAQAYRYTDYYGYRF